MNEKTILFYDYFKEDIISKKKIITIRDYSESKFFPGEIISALCESDGEWFCDLKILEINPIKKNKLNETHANNENMKLDELLKTISDIYPDDEDLYVIKFMVVRV